MKALVMEIKNREMILMTGDGQFLSRPLPREKISIGDEIAVPELTAARKLFTGWMAAAVFLITLLAGSWWWQVPVTPVLGAAVSYVSLDINPSVELGIDDQDQVVSWQGLNEDGRKLLAGLNLAGWKSDEAVAALIEAAAQAGYLDREKGNEIILNLSSDENSAENNEQQENRLAAAAAKALAAQKLVTRVSVLETSLELRDEAQDLGISAAKYAIFLEAESAGLELELEQVKEIGVIKAIKAAGGNPGQVISMAKQEKAFAQKILQWKEKQQPGQEDPDKTGKSEDQENPEDQDNPGGQENPEDQDNPGGQGNPGGQIKNGSQAPESDAGGSKSSAGSQDKSNQVSGQGSKILSENAGQQKAQSKGSQISQDKQSGQAVQAISQAKSVVKKQRAIFWLRDKIKAELRGSSGTKAAK